APRRRLALPEVAAALARLRAATGSGSMASRAAAVRELFARATEQEQAWLVGLITGELRQGASDGVLLPALARAADVPEALVRRAVMLTGFPGPVAAAALLEGPDALEVIRLEVGRPLRPMLAGSEPDLPSAVDGTRDVAVDAKLDGIRLQAHLDRSADPQVRLFTRSLEELTDRLPEVVAVLPALPATRAWWSRTRPRPTQPGVAEPAGSRSSRGAPPTSSCSPSSGAADGGRAGCPTSTWAPVTRRPASWSWSARRSRA